MKNRYNILKRSLILEVLSARIAVSGGDIKARLNKARCAFSRLKNIWKSTKYSLKCAFITVTLRLCYCMALNAGKIVKRGINKVNVFYNSCLRKICIISWINKISNNGLYTRKLDAQVSNLKLRNAGLNGWDMYYECRQRGYLRLPIGGRLQAEGKGGGPNHLDSLEGGN